MRFAVLAVVKSSILVLWILTAYEPDTDVSAGPAQWYVAPYAKFQPPPPPS
jgi:hypothetical protein